MSIQLFFVLHVLAKSGLLLCCQIASLFFGNGNIISDSRTPSGGVRWVKVEACVPKEGIASTPLDCVYWRLDGLGDVFLSFSSTIPKLNLVSWKISCHFYFCTYLFQYPDRCYAWGENLHGWFWRSYTPRSFSRRLPVIFIILPKVFQKVSPFYPLFVRNLFFLVCISTVAWSLLISGKSSKILWQYSSCL